MTRKMWKTFSRCVSSEKRSFLPNPTSYPVEKFAGFLMLYSPSSTFVNRIREVGLKKIFGFSVGPACTKHSHFIKDIEIKYALPSQLILYTRELF